MERRRVDQQEVPADAIAIGNAILACAGLGEAAQLTVETQASQSPATEVKKSADFDA